MCFVFKLPLLIKVIIVDFSKHMFFILNIDGVTEENKRNHEIAPLRHPSLTFSLKIKIFAQEQYFEISSFTSSLRGAGCSHFSPSSISATPRSPRTPGREGYPIRKLAPDRKRKRKSFRWAIWEKRGGGGCETAGSMLPHAEPQEVKVQSLPGKCWGPEKWA